MKVVHVIASGGLYGAEKWVLALMRAMAGSSTSSVLVNFSDTRDECSAVVAAARERGLEAYDFFTGGTFNPLCVFKFARWLKNCSADIVHGHGYKSDLIGLLGARLAGCKMISTPHGWSKEPDRKLQLYERLDRFLFRFMDYVCPLSEELFETVRHVVEPGKLKLILNGVDVEEIDSCAPAFEKKDEFVIGYIGRLVEGKDIPTLIAAVKMLCEKHRDQPLKLFIVGDGEEVENLRKIVADTGLSGVVQFFGFRSDAIALLKCFDVFVLPSLSEGIPRCLMEAMTAGIVCVASDIRGNKVLVEHHKTGFLFSVGDSIDLFEKLRLVIGDESDNSITSRNARKLIEKKFSNMKMAEQYQLLYSEFS